MKTSTNYYATFVGIVLQKQLQVSAISRLEKTVFIDFNLILILIEELTLPIL